MENPYSQEEIKEEILDELKKYTQSESEAEDFFEWIEDNGWANYGGRETWINGRTVISTKTLYKIFNNEIG